MEVTRSLFKVVLLKKSQNHLKKKSNDDYDDRT